MSPAGYTPLHCLNLYILVPITLLCRMLLILIVAFLCRRWQVSGKKKSRVTVVVLGDIGRSPRMQYHALSLAGHGFRVDMVGYGDCQPSEGILRSESITLHFLVKESCSQYFPHIFAYFIRVIMQTLILGTKMLFNVPASEYILMQNPPCIPAMFICWIFSIFNGSKLIIDWHNYGYTILAMSLGKNHKLVKIAHWYEKIFGQLAASEICVTKAMQNDLEDQWHIHAVVLYDRPPEHFKPLKIEERHHLFSRLKKEYPEFGPADDPDSTFCTTINEGMVGKRETHPALIVSSTSWTEDEDFSILLNALKMYDMTKFKTEGDKLPDLICAITGKGPMKDQYMKEIKKVEWAHVKIVTPWLSAEDYPLLIGSSDLGVCLHTSSSGLDLPMKVVDMFGCGVPVAAVGFDCLHELVQDGVNGVIFHNEEGLHENLCDLLTGYPGKQDTLAQMRENLESFRESTWSKNWDENVLPLFNI